MKSPTPVQLQQVHLGIAPDGCVPVSSYQGEQSIMAEEHRILQANLLRSCPAKLWFQNSNEAFCPRPILVTNQHQQQLKQFHAALTAAITDIVARWWSDEEARFPERMPLNREEEELLRWIESQLPRNDFLHRNRLGSWRPDFMVEDDPTNDIRGSIEVFRLTEINARFCFNGFLHQAYGQEALSGLGVGENGVAHETNPSKILDGLLSLFRPDLPLHLIKGDEPGIDIHMFINYMSRRTEIKPRLVVPADLRLLPDYQRKQGYKLCCLVKDQRNTSGPDGSDVLITSHGEVVEEIHQVGVELHQHELFALQPEMLQQISLRCFNDMRTILLVHDKRMLGIVKQEIPSLVARNIITPEKGKALDKGIVDTIIPGSSELEVLIQNVAQFPQRQEQYLLKPVRGGKGNGIIFGDDVGHTEWISALERLRNPQLVSGRPTYVVQRRIRPRLYDIVLKASGERGQYPLIGTYHAVNGQLLGLGVWRSSPDRICAVSHGGTWMCSVIREDS